MTPPPPHGVDPESSDTTAAWFLEASDGFAGVGGDRLRWANPALARLASAPDGRALVGGSWSDLFVGDPGPPPRPGVRAACQLLGWRDEPIPVEVELLAAWRPGSEMEGGDGCGVLSVVQVRDVRGCDDPAGEVLRTGRALHAANREIAGLRERLRGERAQREELLTVVSHELRTPVTVIAGFNRLLLSERVGPLNETQRRFLGESDKSCHRLNAFIANLLEAARDPHTVAPLEVCEAPIAPAVESAVRQFQPHMRERELRIAVALDPAAPRVRYDPLRIAQLLTNLLDNAIKFSPAGGEIEVSARGIDAEGGRQLEVAVADAGPGVAAAERERIFEPYVQTEAARGAAGLGLGLAICRRVAEAHGGALWVEDRSGGGARFVLRLPAAVEPGA